MAKHEKNLHGILAGPKYQVSVPPLFDTENVEGKETLRKKATRRRRKKFIKAKFSITHF